MKQDLLKRLWLRVYILVAIMTTALAGTAWAETESVTFSQQGYSNGEAVASYEGENFSIAFYKGTNNNEPKYYNTGTAMRLYGGNYFTVSSPGTITDIVLTFASGEGTNAITTDVGEFEADTWTGSDSEVTFTIGGTSGHRRIASISVSFYMGASTSVSAPVISGTENFLTQTEVSISCKTEGATISYSTDGSTWETYSTPLVLTETTTVLAKASKSGLNDSSVSSKTFTKVSAMTVAEARAAIDAGTGTQGVYATGIVSAIPTAYNAEYKNITFNFVDAVGDADFLQAYRCGGAQAADVQVGDVVVVYGNLTKYGSTYEFAQGCELISLTHSDTPAQPVIVCENATIAYDQTYYELLFDIENPVDGVIATAATTATWITRAEVSTKSFDRVMIECSANEGEEARTATITITYGDVRKDVTLTQEAYVAPVEDYATLPFAFNGVRADIEETAGLTQSGLGTDYKNPPYLKFDGTGDYMILQFDERPGVLTFDIQGNSFSGGTFKVQASEDGEEYGTIATYTELGTTETKTFTDLGEDIRFIKWIYTEKVTGNVGLGNIQLAKYGSVVVNPTISIAPDEVSAPATDEKSYYSTDLPITYQDIEVSNYKSFTVQFYDAEGTETELPDWLIVGVTGTNTEGYKVSCIIINNDGAARTTYFKVYGYAADGGKVYSNLVTITQAEYIAPSTEDWVEVSLDKLTAEDVFVIVGDNGSTFAMSNDNGTSNAPAAVAVTVADGKLTSAVADNIKWNISSTTDGYVFYPNGSTETWLYCTNTNNGVRVGTGEAMHFTVDQGYLTITETTDQRYIGIYNSQDWRCYKLNDGEIQANIANQTFKFYKKASEAPSVQTVRVSAVGYATMVADADILIPADVEAFSVQAKGAYAILKPIRTAIPAGEAVIVKASEGSYDFPYATESVDRIADNDLVAATSDVTANGSQYVLANPDGAEKPGFYQVTSGSIIPAGKAYLSIVSAGVKVLILTDEDDATGIESLNANTNDIIYDLSGRRLSNTNSKHGVYIVNGKKIMK